MRRIVSPPVRTALAAVAVAAAALLPRAVTLDRAFTIDERLWVERSSDFVAAAAEGRPADTIATGHPGVTTAWIAGVAQRTLPRGAGLRQRYARARLGLAIAAAVLLAVIWVLARALAGGAAAWLTAALVGLDPFLLAHNRVVQLDGLLTLLVVGGLLALMVAARDGTRSAVALAGAFAGLAAITRASGVVLVVPAALLLGRAGAAGIRRFAVWTGAALAAALLCWPALWAAPGRAIAAVVRGSAGASIENVSGRLLSGPAPLRDALFYPATLLWRSSAVFVPAVLLAAVWAVRRRDGADPAAQVRTLLTFAAGYVVLLAVVGKRADRYVLPAMATAEVGVAFAAAAAARHLGARRRAPLARNIRARTRAAAAFGVLALIALHATPALALHPYQLAHYNWLAGGPVVASRFLVVGWGEGLDEAATELSRLPDAPSLTVAASRITGFAEFFPGRTIRLPERGEVGREADLALFYLSSVQTMRYPAAWEQLRRRAAVYELTVNRLPYVRVFRVPGSQR